MSIVEQLMGFEYIQLAPGFAREVLDVYDAWQGKMDVPMKVQELMMVLRIEVSRLYEKDADRMVVQRLPILKDTKLNVLLFRGLGTLFSEGLFVFVNPDVR